jgi:hypothetical protein
MQGWEALTKQEDELLDSGQATQETDKKLKVIAIEPCPILVDQIDTYFVLKSASCYQEIKLLVPHASKYVYLFIDFLLSEVAKREIASKGKGNQNWVMERNYKTLDHNLRMDSWIKTRNWKLIRGRLKKCYETAKRLGYLLDYKTIQGATQELEKLTLNPEKFRKVKEIEAERAGIKAQEASF